MDWYNQRVDACKDPVLRSILEHNRDEEKEHAAMLMEWIRRLEQAGRQKNLANAAEMLQQADAVRAKLAALGISEDDVRDAVAWARQGA